MNSNVILFDRPADDFTNALQIGNGRLGASIYGEILREQVVLNESSMWSGSAEESNRRDAATYLPEIRRLLREGKNYEAQQLFSRHFTCAGKGSFYAHGTDVPFGCYQILGRLQISWFQAVSHGRQDSCGVSRYRRCLNLDEGAAMTEFALAGKNYRREYLVSADFQAICIHFDCSAGGEIDFACGLERDECFAVETVSDDLGRPVILMHGQLADGCGTDRGIRYACAMGVTSVGGSIFAESGRLHVKEADEACIFLTAGTDLSGFMGKKPNNPADTVLVELSRVRNHGWEEIREAHQRWYRRQYDAFSIHFGEQEAPNAGGRLQANQDRAEEDPSAGGRLQVYRNNAEKAQSAGEGAAGGRLQVYRNKAQKDQAAGEKTTGERLRAYRSGAEDPGLLELYIQNARAQMIGSSQPGGFPANLQGIWADEILTPWNGDWHLNAQQMIYWLTEKTGLTENTVPYLRLTAALTKPGARTARAYYGTEGWLAHTFTNPWGFTSPGEDAGWGSTTGSPAWQCHHLWEHYLYTCDRDYLAWAYPIMKGAAQFYMGNLVEDEEGRLITSPSSSPENCFVDEQGRLCSLCEGPAYDRELVSALADYCIQAQYVLKNDPEFAQKLTRLKERLAPVTIAPDGRIREWNRDFCEAYPYHRHLSHLWGVYPGNQISPEKTPALARAAVNSLAARGRTTAGWAIAFRAALWARLREADHAYAGFQDLICYATAPNLMNLAYHCDETEQNPPVPDPEHVRYPFQLDGNQGGAAALLLMILDDDARVLEDGTMETVLYLLPALPKQMKSGKIRGARVKGARTVDMDWKDGKVTYLKITPSADLPGRRLRIEAAQRTGLDQDWHK